MLFVILLNITSKEKIVVVEVVVIVETVAAARLLRIKPKRNEENITNNAQ